MALTFTQTASWVTSGTDGGSGRQYKEVPLTGLAAGDLLVAVGICENHDAGPSASTISTQAGTLSAWTTASLAPTADGSCAFVMAWATVTSGATATVRASMATDNAALHMGAGVWKIPAAEWTGTPGFTNWGPNSTSLIQAVTISASSFVLMAGGDWSAGTPAGSDPTGATVHARDVDAALYAYMVQSWTAQTTSDSFGLTSGGNDWGGVVALVEGASAGATVTHTATSAVTAASPAPTVGAALTIVGVSTLIG